MSATEIFFVGSEGRYEIRPWIELDTGGRIRLGQDRFAAAILPPKGSSIGRPSLPCPDRGRFLDWCKVTGSPSPDPHHKTAAPTGLLRRCKCGEEIRWAEPYEEFGWSGSYTRVEARHPDAGVVPGPKAVLGFDDARSLVVWRCPFGWRKSLALWHSGDVRVLATGSVRDLGSPYAGAGEEHLAVTLGPTGRVHCNSREGSVTLLLAEDGSPLLEFGSLEESVSGQEMRAQGWVKIPTPTKLRGAKRWVLR